MEKLNKVFKIGTIAEIDKYTIEHEPVTSLGLMERAACIWTNFFKKKFIFPGNVTVIAGIGNNGGDGYAIAALLLDSGWDVEVYGVGCEEMMSADCAEYYKRYCTMGGQVYRIDKVSDFKLLPGRIVIDAIFGSGLNRPVKGVAAEVIREINRAGNTVVAVDIPSGLLGEDNSGNVRDCIVKADYTFTFQFPKLSFMLAENAYNVGQWEVLDIGLHPGIINSLSTPYYYITAETVAGILPVAEKFAHKGMNGRGLLIAGKEGMMGAAVLAARASLRSGVGLLHCHVPGKSANIIQQSVPEALVSIDCSERVFSGVPDLSAYDAVAVGPAIGEEAVTVEGLRHLLSSWRGITVLDADALNILAGHPELIHLLHDKCILTPHLKEFERLAGKCGNDFERLNKLSTFAKQYRIYVILKGAYSVIAVPEGDLYFNMSGNPGMAKGGAGDVLTGVLLALGANGLKPLDIALAGVFAHGLSGDIVAEKEGIRGICAGMIADGMGKAWRELENLKSKKNL